MTLTDFSTNQEEKSSPFTKKKVYGTIIVKEKLADEVLAVAKNKSGKINGNNRDNGNNSLLMGIGVGAVLLVLAEIFCILAEIYYMLSGVGHIVVILISALLLLGTTGAFLYILKNALMEKLDEQEQMYGEMLQISKATYMKMKKLAAQPKDEEELSKITEMLYTIADGIKEDIVQELKKQSEEIYKRQMSIANAQVKRNREDISVVLNSNKHGMEAIEQKLGTASDSALSREAIAGIQDAIINVRDNIKDLYALCEKIASEPVGVHIEPLPKEVLENVTEPEIETMIEEVNPEPMPEAEEAAQEPAADELETEEAAQESAAGEPEPLPAADGDANRQLTPEEIAALFSNL